MEALHMELHSPVLRTWKLNSSFQQFRVVSCIETLARRGPDPRSPMMGQALAQELPRFAVQAEAGHVSWCRRCSFPVGLLLSAGGRAVRHLVSVPVSLWSPELDAFTLAAYLNFSTRVLNLL